MQIVHAHALGPGLPLPATAQWPQGVPFVQTFQRGSMRTEFCALRGTDHQTTHTQDELYFILDGSATFVCEGQAHAVNRGHAILVPAGEAHRFQDLSDDFAAWVVFWGPDAARSPPESVPPE